MELVFFFIFATIAVISAGLVITLRNPVHSVVSLIVCFFQIAGLFVLLRSPFIAGAQLFIYVGAIMVFFIFAVFLLDIRSSMAKPRFSSWSAVGIPITLFLLAEVLLFIVTGTFGEPVRQDASVLSLLSLGKSTEAIGQLLYTKYLLPFEIISVVLLIGFVGAVVLTVKGNKEE